jgi:large subunit ribosomal protein L35
VSILRGNLKNYNKVFGIFRDFCEKQSEPVVFATWPLFSRNVPQASWPHLPKNVYRIWNASPIRFFEEQAQFAGESSDFLGKRDNLDCTSSNEFEFVCRQRCQFETIFLANVDNETKKRGLRLEELTIGMRIPFLKCDPVLRIFDSKFFRKSAGELMGNKMKTHKGVKKRFRLSASGKAKHRPCGTSHRNVRVSSKRKRRLRGGDAIVHKTFEAKIQRALGKYSN